MKICIFGLGRIGLPIALVCSDCGFNVTGIDVNKELIINLKQKKIPFNELGMSSLLNKNLNKTFFPKHQYEDFSSDLINSEFIIITVGTGFAKYPEKPNLSTLYSIIGQLIVSGLKDKTIILRVTLPVGTTDGIKKFIEEKTGLKEGEDFWFSFVPERLMEGKAISEERSLPKIVATYNDDGFEKVKNFFKKIGGDIIRVSNPRTAEFIKLIDNSWRSTRFAFANDLAFLAEENGIDVMEAIDSANAGYKRNAIPIPGPVSGYCLGKDPYLLELAFREIVKKRGFGSVWFYGRRANDWLVEKVINEINGDNVLIAGLSFKENIDDYRFSHGIEITRKLIEKGYNVSVCDPFLGKNYYTLLPDDIALKVQSFNSIDEALSIDVDTLVLATRHNEYVKLDFKKIISDKIEFHIKVIDLWNIIKSEYGSLKISYQGFGRGKK